MSTLFKTSFLIIIFFRSSEHHQRDREQPQGEASQEQHRHHFSCPRYTYHARDDIFVKLIDPSCPP